MKKTLFFFSFLLMVITACGSKTGQVVIERQTDTTAVGSSFVAKDNPICMKDGKPIIREFATSWCPHCAWIKPIYQEVIKKYGNQIVAYQWEVDTGNDLLTEELEFEVPTNEMTVFKTFSPNQAIPTFVFGCKYARVGNAFEEQNNKQAEAAEFKAVIDKLLSEVEQQ